MTETNRFLIAGFSKCLAYRASNAVLKVEFRFSPINIEQVNVNLPARIRFSSFNQRTTPELIGTVSDVSPATSRDTQRAKRIIWPAPTSRRFGWVGVCPRLKNHC